MVLLMIGVVKLVLAPLGNQVRRLVPRAGLLGSLAAIALALIAFLPLVNDGIASVPLIGMLVLSIVLFSLVAHQRLPFGIPGALAAFTVGLIIHGVGMAVDSLTGAKLVPPLGLPSQHGMELFVFWTSLGRGFGALACGLAFRLGHSCGRNRLHRECRGRW